MKIRTFFCTVSALLLGGCGGGGGGSDDTTAGKAVLVPKSCADCTLNFQWGDTTFGGMTLVFEFKFTPDYTGSNEGSFTASIIKQEGNTQSITYTLSNGRWKSTPATPDTVNIYDITAGNTEVSMNGNLRLKLLNVQENAGIPTKASGVFESGKIALTFTNGPTYAPAMTGIDAAVTYTAR